MTRRAKYWMAAVAAAVLFHRPCMAEQIKWEAYTPQKVQAALAQHRPVVIDYSAEWCPGCHALDQMIFTDPKVASKLSQVAALRVDATDMDAPKVQDLIDQNNIIGLPTVLFLDSSGREIKDARIEGAGPVEEFLRSFKLLAQANHIKFKE